MKPNKLTKTLAALVLLAALVSPAAVLADSASSTASVAFTNGVLEFGTAPVYDFGSHAVPATTAEYNAESVGDALVVKDSRGTGVGWSVEVALTNFTYMDDSTPVQTLTGSYIEFTGGAVEATGGTIVDANNAKPELESPITVYAGGAAESVLNAADGTGRGSFATSWSKSQVKLVVPPGDVKAGTSNSATLNWALNNPPA